jgi:putative methionine-R-sulfoxide reductase with GAF domain
MDDIGSPGANALRDHVDLVLEIGLRINAEYDLDRLLQLTVEAVKERLNYSYCAILLKEGADLVIRAVTEYPETILHKRIPIGSGISGRCAASKTESLVSDLSQCPYYVHLGDQAFASELDIPIVFRGKVLGVLNTQSTQTNAFDGYSGPQKLDSRLR